MDLIVEDDSRIGSVYFLMSEENVREQIRQPWVSFGSDAGAPATEEPFTLTATHPRAYGNFARLLGKYVRDEGVISLEEAIQRLTSLPATNLGLTDRGRLEAATSRTSSSSIPRRSARRSRSPTSTPPACATSS